MIAVRRRDHGLLIQAALQCYPRSWRYERQAELLWMVDQERCSGRPVSGASLIDIAGHGLEARVEAWLRPLHQQLRARASVLATGAAAVLSLLFLATVELGGLTSGTVVFVGFMSAFGLMAGGRGGPARLVSVLSTACAAAIPIVSATVGASRPPLFVLGPLFMLGLLSCLATVQLTRRHRVRLFTTTAVAAGVLALQLVGWCSYANRGLGFSWYRDRGDLSILAIAVQGTIFLGLVAVIVRRMWWAWLAAFSLTATLLLLYCDPDEPVLALAIAAVCWAATAAVGAARPAPVSEVES